MEIDQELCQFLKNQISKKFPFDICCAFAYGSAVFKQEDDKKKLKMIDIILVVEEPEQFHKKNLILNHRDYSFIKYLGAKSIDKIFHKTSAGVYFNPYCWFDKQQMKYGVVSKEKLTRDLLEWSYLYVAGRLHKPVMWLKPDISDPKIAEGLDKNFENAVRAAILTLPENFSEKTLYHRICDISYLGDIRTFFNLDLLKSQKIVAGNFRNFQLLYQPYLDRFKCSVDFKNGEFQQDLSSNRIISEFQKLPACFHSNAIKIINKNYTPNLKNKYGDVSHAIKDATKSTLRKIVSASSTYQSLKGLPTAGILKAASYVWNKIP